MTNDDVRNKLEKLCWEKLVIAFQTLGEIALKPADFTSGMIVDRQSRADSTSIWIGDIKTIFHVDDQIEGGLSLLNFIYNKINEREYGPARLFIDETALYKIVRYTSPASGIIIFPDDAIPIFKNFLKTWGI